MEENITPSVFISYSHDSIEHKQNVLALANQLRSDGVDCNIDQYVGTPPEGWPNWMTTEITSADFVLIVCTETYFNRVTGKEEEGKGLGAIWEAGLITQEIYDAGGKNSKFIPVVLNSQNSKYRPTFLKPTTYYNLDSLEDYRSLYRRLTTQPAVVKPPLGKRKILPPTEAPTTDTLNLVEPLHNEGNISKKTHSKESKDWSSLVLIMDSKGGFSTVHF